MAVKIENLGNGIFEISNDSDNVDELKKEIARVIKGWYAPGSLGPGRTIVAVVPLEYTLRIHHTAPCLTSPTTSQVEQVCLRRVLIVTV